MLYKKRPESRFIKKIKRPSSTNDTTISNVMFGDNTPSKDYGKIKNKGGLPKSNTIVSSNKRKK